MAKRIDTKRLIEEIVDAICTDTKDKMLVWRGEDEVSVTTCEIFPKGSAVRMTQAPS